MDDSAKTPPNQDDSQAVAIQQNQISQPVMPVSGPHKEAVPLSGHTGEYLRTAEAKPEVAKEVAEVGVEHVIEDKPNIPQEVANAGVVHAKETVPHPSSPTGVVSYPQVSQQQALVMKKRSVKDAARWLAMLVLRQFDKIAYQKLPTK